MFELAQKDRRQIFVLLRDASDAQLIAGCGSGAQVVDLAAVRGLQSALADRARLAPPVRRELPDPSGMAGPDWARAIGVQTLDPWLGVEGAHLYWLLFEERELLAELLSWGVERLGPLRELVSADAATFLDNAQRGRIEAAASFFEAVRRGWLIGRGLPLTREVLDTAGVTSTFLDRIAELSDELGGDAKRLIAAIEARDDERTKGYRQQKLDAVRENLEQSGHLDPREVLDDASAWLQLLTDLRDTGGIDPLELRARFEFLRARFDEALAP